MNPQYSDQYLNELYSSYQTTEQLRYRKGHTESVKKHSHELNIIDIEKYTGAGKFLSIGCGSGYDLVEARKRGWKVEGYEVNPDFSKEVSHQLQVEIRSGRFLDLDYSNYYFDCVYMNHVIEHLKDPSAYLQKCKQILKKGGILYIACPNIASFSNRGKKILEKIKVKGLKGNYYDTWHHLFYFSPSVLKNLLEEYYGFKVLYTGNDRKLKVNQSSVTRTIINILAYGLPYKAGFRLIAQKL